MALCISWLSAVYSILWIILSSNEVSSSTRWSHPQLEYRLENPLEEYPHLSLLDADPHVERHRRYVPDSPLDEFSRHNRFLTNPNLQDNIPPSRQTKDIKFSDGKAGVVPQADLSDNSAARITPPPPLSSTTPTHTSPQSTSANNSVIISADFGNSMAADVRPSVTPTDDDLAISKYTDEVFQSTMTQNNITVKQEDHHVYYNSTFLIDHNIGQSYWVDMTKRDDVRTNHMLSRSHRRAATVKLSFDFPFYGHMVRNVTIATGGFLYTGEYVHSWLAATQYIAPLMANFDTSISNDSYIKYVDNGTAFTVQWEKVVLQDKPDSGEFTFQATLHNTGDIVFVYQNVPVIIEKIQDDQHPVKVGLSDAYIIDRTIFFVRRKTIYEYHRVNFNREDIKNWTVIYLNALPTCMEKKDCSSCVSAHINFECKWCPGARRCSTGMDRQRQDWLFNECDRTEVTETLQCDELTAQTEQHPSASAAAAAASPETGEMQDGGVRMGGSGYLGAAFILVLIAGVAIWTLYAYSNPHSYSGQILINYRPSQWRWRRGEARYTAATIHM